VVGSNLITIKPGSASVPPLFCVHAEAGDVSLYVGLARHLACAQPLLGLCAPPSGEPYGRLEDLAERHVRDMRGAQAGGPYLILGECTGGALAYEIAQQLRSAGEEIGMLALVDAFAPGLPRLAELMPRPVYRVVHRARILGFHAENIIRMGMNARLAYVASKLGRARRALMVKASALMLGPGASAAPRHAFKQALAAYRPRPYAGSIVVFRATRLPLGSQAPPDLGWGALSGRVELERMPGYFTTVISEPGVQMLADGLTRRMAALAGVAWP
jgi:thioesterase domain-containing protein